MSNLHIIIVIESLTLDELKFILSQTRVIIICLSVVSDVCRRTYSDSANTIHCMFTMPNNLSSPSPPLPTPMYEVFLPADRPLDVHFYIYPPVTHPPAPVCSAILSSIGPV